MYALACDGERLADLIQSAAIAARGLNSSHELNAGRFCRIVSPTALLSEPL